MDVEQPGESLESEAKTEVTTEAEVDPLLEALTEEEKPTEEEIEEELEGVKLRGRKEALEKIKAERLMQSDYTRKTQELAAQRGEVEKFRSAAEQQHQFNQQYLQEAAHLKALDLQLQHLNSINLQQLAAEDPTRAQQLDYQRREVERALNQGVQSLRHKHELALQQQQGQLASLTEQASAYLAREIKDWTPERDAQVAKYAVERGVPKHILAPLIAHVPALGVVLHKAEQYDALVAKANKRPPPEPQTAPVTQLAPARAQVNKDPSRMSDAEFAQWRKRQIAQRH